MGEDVVMVGASDDIVPLGDFLFEGLALLAIVLQRVVAQRKVHRWLGRGGETDNSSSQLYRIARLIVAGLGGIFAHGAGGFRIVFDDLFRAHKGSAVEKVGPEITGFDRCRKDAERRELLSQSFRNAFDGELRRAVDSPTCRASEAANRREINHVARALAAHMGQDRARDLQQAKDVSIINAPRFLVTDLLHAAEKAEAGVVGQHVDGVEFLHRLGRDLHSLEFVVDVQDGDVEVRMMIEFGSKLLRPTAHRANDLVAAGEDGFANFETEAARGPGDNPCFRLSHTLLVEVVAGI